MQYTKVIERRAVDLVYAGRKDRRIHPEGRFDNAGRWWPSDDEDADSFTLDVRTPSKSWPYSYMKAARSKRHIKALAEVNIEFVLKEASALDAEFKQKVEEHRAMEAKAAERRAERRARELARDEELTFALSTAFPA